MSGIVKVKVGDKIYETEPGISVAAFLASHNIKSESPFLGAIINNRLKPLNTPITTSCSLIPLTVENREAESIYKRTVSLLLYAVMYELYPDVKVIVGQSIGDGYFMELVNLKVTDEVITNIKNKMKEYIELSKPIITRVVTVEEAYELFEKRRLTYKLNLLKTWRDEMVPIVQLGDFIDIQHGPFAPHVGVVDRFDVVPYRDGIVLRFFVGLTERDTTDTLLDLPKLFHIYRETKEWNKLIGVAHLSDLNEKIIKGEIREIINVAEGLHEKKIAQIADEIVKRKDEIKLILVAGPSASGKTTFSKRLSIQLMVNGIKPIPLSLDNWYVDREKTPKDEEGNYDFENIDALDLSLFNQNLSDLLSGKKTLIPRFDFVTGKRMEKDKWVEIKLEPNQMLIIEGIHGLNERLTISIPPKNKYKIYVSALTQLCIDEHNRIFTSDVRLLRRIVRDRRYRGYSAAETITLWPRVRRGECKYIFPYQEDADVMFNSALVYETSVLKVFAEMYLFEIPKDHPAQIEAQRLLKFLDLFIPILSDYVPHTSILREFIGGSVFQYK